MLGMPSTLSLFSLVNISLGAPVGDTCEAAREAIESRVHAREAMLGQALARILLAQAGGIFPSIREFEGGANIEKQL